MSELERIEAAPPPQERSVDDLLGHMEKVHDAMQRAMKEGEHYGVIPGTQKPTLLKPGAEMLLVLFKLGADYESAHEWADDHLTVTTKCTLRHIPSGNWIGSGEGLCTTREKRYAERKQSRTCPACGAEAIIKGKEEYGGGWVCFKKKGGCGAKYQDGDPAIENQPEGVVPNEDLADLYNTVLKMANKRALIAAVLNATAASQVFTQDLEPSARQASPDPGPASSADERLILVELVAQKGGMTIPEAEAWLAEQPRRGEQRWVARQVLALLLREARGGDERPASPTASAVAGAPPSAEPELPPDPLTIDVEVEDDDVPWN